MKGRAEGGLATGKSAPAAAVNLGAVLTLAVSEATPPPPPCIPSHLKLTGQGRPAAKPQSAENRRPLLS